MKDFRSEYFCFLLSCMSKIVHSCSVMTLSTRMKQNFSMDFNNLNGAWKLKRFCITCIELIFKFFFSVSFVVSLNFSLIFIFRCIKPV